MRAISLLPFLAFAASAQAGTLCTFDTECLEGEGCGPTTFIAERGVSTGDVVTLTTDAESLQGHMIASDDNQHFVFEAPTAAHLLTEYPGGAARYTVHLDGPFTITYHGICEDKP